MSKSGRRLMGWWICLVVGLVMVPGLAQAADLKEGVEQVAVQLAKSVPEGRVFRVAVTDFPDLQGVTSDLGRYIAERLTTRLSQAPKFRVIERRRLSLVLGELKFSMSDLVDPSKAKRLGQMLGVEGLVVGSISDLGNQVEVDARIIEIETSNILPGVSASISKDQVVGQLLTQGREATLPASPTPGPTVSGMPGPPVASLPQRSGVHPIGKEFGEWFGNVRVFSVEIVEARFLQFNLDFTWMGRQGTGPREFYVTEVYLDSPQDTTFLIDQSGRQYPLVRAVGISPDQPTKVARDGSRRFALLFPLPPGMESLKYQAVLFMRAGNESRRLRIESREPIHLRDFR